jgi:predicted Zn-ribbon and HTH transcriptional regulator
MTSTVPGDALRATLQRIVADLGTYPHAKVDPNARKKQGTRLLKLQCSDCGWTARVSALQANRLHAASTCPVCIAVGSLNVEA